MELLEGVRLALAHIRSQKLKSFFSVLGVIIGVMFLMVVVSVVEGMDRYIKEDFASQVFGINTITRSAAPPPSRSTPSDEAAKGLGPASPHHRGRTWTDPGEAEHSRPGWAWRPPTSGHPGGDNGREVENVQPRDLGRDPPDPEPPWWSGAAHFSIQEAERGVPVIVLGKNSADVLFEGRRSHGTESEDPGVPVPGGRGAGGAGIPLRNVDGQPGPGAGPVRHAGSRVNSRGMWGRSWSRPWIPPTCPALMELEGILRGVRALRPLEPNNFELETADESLSFWDRISRILFVALPGLVSIALVVGGIVIMNIMLVSVMERTREIGVRKALGARQRDILTQVLVESATLSGLGAILGVAVGVGLGAIVRAVSPLPAWRLPTGSPWVSAWE
jgi:putative ABC transport system permease protein